MITYTPWGDPQTTLFIAKGITHYTTSSHGGYQVSKVLNKVIKKKLPNFKPYGGEGWYEEDLDFVLVIVCFPQYFELIDCQEANRIFAANQEYFNRIKP